MTSVAPEVFARCQKKRHTQVAAIKRPFYWRALCDSVTRQTPTVVRARQAAPPLLSDPPLPRSPQAAPDVPSKEGAAITRPQQTQIRSPARPAGAWWLRGCAAAGGLEGMWCFYPSEVVGRPQGAPRPLAAMNKRPSSKCHCSWVLSGPTGQGLCEAEPQMGSARPWPPGERHLCQGMEACRAEQGSCRTLAQNQPNGLPLVPRPRWLWLGPPLEEHHLDLEGLTDPEGGAGGRQPSTHLTAAWVLPGSTRGRRMCHKLLVCKVRVRTAWQRRSQHWANDV